MILDLSSVTRLDPTVAADLRDLEAHADSRGCRLHIAGAASERQPDRREHPPETRAATGIPRGQARDLLRFGQPEQSQKSRPTSNPITTCAPAIGASATRRW